MSWNNQKFGKKKQTKFDFEKKIKKPDRYFKRIKLDKIYDTGFKNDSEERSEIFYQSND